MKNLLTESILILFLFCFTSTLFAQGSFKLQYNFEKGKVYHYNSDGQTDITQSMMGQEMKIKVNTNLYSKMEIEDTSPDSFVSVYSLDSGKVRTTMPMRDTTMNLDNLVNKRTRLTFSKVGKIIKVEIIDSVKGSGMEIINQLRGEAYKCVFLPEKEINFGEIWNSTDLDSINMLGGKLIHHSNNDYTLVGKIDTLGYSCIKIEYKGKTTSEGSAKIMGMDLVIEGSGKNTGVIYFDLKEGIVIYSASQIDNEMTMAATGEQNMIIPISQSTKSTVTFLEK
jgi:hypothetical protein